MKMKPLFIVAGIVFLGSILYLVYTSYISGWVCKLSGGGYWKVRGVCVYDTKDAGKLCSDSSECESYCMAPGGSDIGAEAIGKCLERTDANCIKEVKNGIVQKQFCKEPIID